MLGKNVFLDFECHILQLKMNIKTWFVVVSQGVKLQINMHFKMADKQQIHSF